MTFKLRFMYNLSQLVFVNKFKTTFSFTSKLLKTLKGKNLK